MRDKLVLISDNHGNSHGYKVFHSGKYLDFIVFNGELVDDDGGRITTNIPYHMLESFCKNLGLTLGEEEDVKPEEAYIPLLWDSNFTDGDIYYAHCIGLYNTPQEERDMKLMTDLGWKVYNPNDPSEGPVNLFKELKLGVSYDTAFDAVWGNLVKRSSMLVFRALPDGSIPKGVAREIEIAKEYDIPILELPNAILRRSLTGEETREYLRDIGYR